MTKINKKFDRESKKNQKTNYAGFFKTVFFLNTTPFKKVIDDELGVSPNRGRYGVVQYYDIIMTTLMLRFTKKGSAEHCYDLDEKSPKLMPFRIPCADTLLRKIATLKVKSLKEKYFVKKKGKSGKEKSHKINLNDRLNKLLMKVIVAMGLTESFGLNRTDAVVDIDATDQVNWNKDGDFTFKKKSGYVPTVSVCQKLICYIQNAGGNTPASYGLLRITQNTFKNLREFGIKVNKLRMDAAGDTDAIKSWCVDNKITYFIRASRGRFAKYITTIKEPSSRKPAAGESRWREATIREKNGVYIKASVTSIYLTTDGNEIRYVIQRTKKKAKDIDDETAVVIPGSRYVYRAIGTTHFGWGDERVINFYNQRGENAENSIKDSKLNFNWDNAGSHRFEVATVHLFLNAICRIVYQAYLQHLVENKTIGAYTGMWLSTFTDRFISVIGTVYKDKVVFDKNDPFKQAA